MAKNNGLNTIMGARNNAKTERQKDDFYATDPKTVKIFLDTIKKDGIKLNSNLWECSCGLGHISNVLKEYGYSVVSTDIINRGYNDFTLDFLKIPHDKKANGDIITNPPYKLQEDFVKQGLNLLKDGNKLILYLKIQFLEGVKRHKEIFSVNPPKYIYIHSTRQTVARDGDFEAYGGKANTICFIWCIWEKGYKGDSIVRWIA